MRMTNIWPLQSQCLGYYGDPRSPSWLHANTIDVPCPWPLHMGGIAIPRILIHKKCAESLARVLNGIWEATGKSLSTIQKLRYDVYDGSYNLRNIRGSASSLSMHAFAAAIDWDAADNVQHSQKHLFQDDSLLVVKFKEQGWIWGGDWSPGSIDAMHVQAARIHA
jgi:D-alanyl-D-alanine carboxypeptidase